MLTSFGIIFGIMELTFCRIIIDRRYKMVKIKCFERLLYVVVCLLPLPMAYGQQPAYLNDELPMEVRVEDALCRMTLDEKIAMIHAQSKFSTPGCPRLGIPEIWMSDGPHGVRMEIAWDDWDHAGWTNDSCTALPALTCLAATFNPELAREYGDVIGREANFRKKDIMLGPGVNIYRTPLSGRNFEYMGEDPYLSSTMVVPYIQGLQSNGVAACMKHFALNNQEYDREKVNVEVDDRALNEIYLPAFHAGVKAGVWAMMGSYNKFRGTFCSHNDLLINKILKGDWGFDGVMITDWGSCHDTREAALNGLDIEMGSWTNGLTWGVSSAYDNYYMARPLKELVAQGEIDESVIDEKVRRVLRLNFRTNMNRRRPFGAMNTDEHREVARRIASEGIVLLKNDNKTLPLKPGKFRKIAVIGDNATKKLTLGGGSSELKPKVEISPLDGLKAIYGDAIEFSLGYASGVADYSREIPSPLDADSLRYAAVEIASGADAVIFVGGLNKNYKQDCEGGDRLSYDLPYNQNQLISELLEVNPNTVVVLTSGNAVAMPWKEKIPAIVQSWYNGSMGGFALADIIAGNINPSGKLPFTIAERLEDYPAHGGDARTYPGQDGTVHYDEGIFVGYRWAETKGVEPAFAFGHGLSYTDFAYSSLETDKKVYAPDDIIRVTLKVKNTGKVDGAETVQFYCSQSNPRLERPVKELKAFCKPVLRAGESTLCSVDIPVASLAYYDDTQQKWILDDDEYIIHAASASDDVRQSISIKINNNLISLK